MFKVHKILCFHFSFRFVIAESCNSKEERIYRSPLDTQRLSDLAKTRWSMYYVYILGLTTATSCHSVLVLKIKFSNRPTRVKTMQHYILYFRLFQAIVSGQVYKNLAYFVCNMFLFTV